MADFTNVSLDIDDLTLDELEIVEDYLDMPLDDLQKPGQRKAKVLRVLAFVAVRRTNPDVTMDEIGSVKISQFGGKSDPTKGSVTESAS